MRSSKVVKILSAKTLYEPHIYLENGDTVVFGSKIQRVVETYSTDGSLKNTIHGRWRSSSSYDFKQSEDKTAFRKSITRDSDMFKKIAASARKIVEDREKKTETGSISKDSDTSSADSESSESDFFNDLPKHNCKEDSNGLILGPKCSQECFISIKKCNHKKEQVSVNETEEFLAFNATWWHHGYFTHSTELTYFTAQLFCVPSRQMQCTERVRRNTTILQNYIVGRLDEEVVSGLTRDLVTKWDDNDKHGYSVKKFPPTNKFLGKGIDKTKNRYIRFKDIAKLPRLHRVTTEIEDRIGHITVDSVWLIKKTRADDGFQEWHQDMKHNITTTVIINVGVVDI